MLLLTASAERFLHQPPLPAANVLQKLLRHLFTSQPRMHRTSLRTPYGLQPLHHSSCHPPAAGRLCASPVSGFQKHPLAHSYTANRVLLRKLDRAHNTATARTWAHAPTSSAASHGDTVCRLPAIVKTLNQEQLDAATTKKQHVRVVAGPGSGKTRVVAARVGYLLSQGIAARSILVITFTNKAANELQARLSRETGRMPYGLLACTFHSLCIRVLRKYGPQCGLPVGSVADDEESKAVIRTILERRLQLSQTLGNATNSDGSDLNGRPSDQGRATAGEAAGPSGSSTPADNKDLRGQAAYYRKCISNMKNFVTTTHSGGRPKSGYDIVQELVSQGLPGFKDLKEAQATSLASMYDSYKREMAWSEQWDFDDILHDCLALLHHHPEVLAELHQQWQHVIVDEGQDTNLCQFELVRAITGPRSHLFMVGDPDQAIYGFRGSQARLMQQDFVQTYHDTCATYYLSGNYRSVGPLVAFADMIRIQGRPEDYQMVPARSMRADQGSGVRLHQADDERQEIHVIIEQLYSWHKQGYPWDQMAVLSRVKAPLKLVYDQAMTRGIPAQLHTGGLWSAPEVKAALALLQAVVYPRAAGEAIKKRIICSTSNVRVPVTEGLGEKSIASIQSSVAAAALDSIDSTPHSAKQTTGTNSSDANTGSVLPPSLGACLLAGCGVGALSKDQAEEVLRQWLHAVRSGADRGGCLSTLAARWQQPPGLKPLSRTRQAGLDRLRGCVQLASAAAVVGLPMEQIVMILLQESGLVPSLIKQTQSQPLQKSLMAERRLSKLSIFHDMAANFAVNKVALVMDDAADGVDWSQDAYNKMLYAVSPDNAALPDAGTDSVELLHQFLESCVLQGDEDESLQAPDNPRVQFMTMHAAKGKEFDCVVAMCFYQGILPSDKGNTEDHLEQERNTAYVAVTRPKDHLLITWPAVVRTAAGKEKRTAESEILSSVLAKARQGKMPGVRVSAPRTK